MEVTQSNIDNYDFKKVFYNLNQLNAKQNKIFCQLSCLT